MSAQLTFGKFEEELLNPLSGHSLSGLEAFVAALLQEASSAKPIKIDAIIVATGRRLAEWPNARQVKAIVRRLRKVHGFPILSRKGKPAGYWWGVTPDEMEEFICDWRKQAMDELHTLSKIVKQNYPELAGQLTLEDL